MQFITNRIRTGKGKSFADLVKELSQPKQDPTVKTASTKVAEEEKKETKDEGPSSGQLDVEPLHQKGESTEMPKKGPSAKKEDGKAEASAKKEVKAEKKEKDEADSSGQPEAEAKLNNDPKVEKEQKGGASKAETKQAAEVCEKCKKPCGECKCEDCKCASCTKAKKVAETKKAALEDLPQEVQDKINGKKTEDGEEDEKPCSDSKTKKAVTKKMFVKVSNLDTKNKGFLRKFWNQLYPSEYVDSMLADK